MEGQLLGVHESENATIRIYTGKHSDTPEKLQKLMESAMKSFAKSIRRSNPEVWKQITERREKP